MVCSSSLLHGFHASEHDASPAFPWRTCGCQGLWRLNAEGHRLFLSVSSEGTDLGEEKGGHGSALRGLRGSGYPLKVYLSRRAATGSLTLVDGVNVLTPHKSPGHLVLFAL